MAAAWWQLDGCLPPLREGSRAHMARSRAVERCLRSPSLYAFCPWWRLDESLWRSGSASCLAYEDPPLRGTAYV
eukprot:12292849-Alexandrium_andersonii.AAC.1